MDEILNAIQEILAMPAIIFSPASCPQEYVQWYSDRPPECIPEKCRAFPGIP